MPIRPCLLCCVLLAWNGLAVFACEQLQHKDLNIAAYYDNLDLALRQIARLLPRRDSMRGVDDALRQRSWRNRLIVYGKLCERVRNNFYRFGKEHPDMLQSDDRVVWEFLDLQFKSPTNRFAMSWDSVDPAHMRDVLQGERDFCLRARERRR